MEDGRQVTEFSILDQAARGMSAQRTILDLAARNVAAAQAATPGHPYQRLVASLTEPPADGIDDDVDDRDAGDDDGADATVDAAVRVGRETGTGDALTELIAVLDAQRAYEANASIFDIGKRLAERTLDVDR
jgi:flagellar basal body rod protein FlgC